MSLNVTQWPIAQSAEHPVVTRKVAGSTPARSAKARQYYYYTVGLYFDDSDSLIGKTCSR